MQITNQQLTEQYVSLFETVNAYRSVLNSRRTLYELRNSTPFIKPDGSLPCSQTSAIGSYPEPVKSSPHLPIQFLYDPA